MTKSKIATLVAVVVTVACLPTACANASFLDNRRRPLAPVVSPSIRRGGGIGGRRVKKASESNAAVVSPGSGVGGGGTATIPNEILNLVKSIVGAGVLSLPAGIAAFGDAPSALLPAVSLIAIVGVLSGYAFSLLGRVCSFTGAVSYRDAWDKSVGEPLAWIPAVFVTLQCALANVAYSMILADTFKALLATAGKTVSRSNTLFGITGLVLLPLCLMKNLSSLAPFSLLGSVGMAYTALAMAVRYFGGRYGLPDGDLLRDLNPDLSPSFGSSGASAAFGTDSFILICMLGTAYLAHFNAPKFYVELKNNTVERFNAVVSTSFGISILIFSTIASLGFLTFGKNCDGLILNNYSNRDALMGLSRVAVAISIVFSYPLVFVGTRDGILDLMNVPNSKRSDASTLNNLTLLILGVVTFLALKIKDLSFLLSFGGAAFGTSLIYLFPALMFRQTVKDMGDDASRGLKAEVTGAMAMAIMGLGMGVVGGWTAIKGH